MRRDWKFSKLPILPRSSGYRNSNPGPQVPQTCTLTSCAIARNVAVKNCRYDYHYIEKKRVGQLFLCSENCKRHI